MRPLAVFCFAMLALAGCEKEFARPAPESLILGRVTQQEIRVSYGRPVAERTSIVGAPVGAARGAGAMPAVAGRFTVLTYVYTPPGARLFAAQPHQKQIVFEFFNDRLYAYNFV